MAMTERAFAYQEEEYFEQRRLRVLTGAAAKEKANTRRSDVVKIALAAFSVLVYFLMSAFIEGQINLVNAEINTLKNDIAEMENEALKADLTIGELSSLERIEEYAIANLGMIAPASCETYYLNEESSVAVARAQAGMPAPAAAEPVQTAEESTFLHSVTAMIAGYFNGTALAATEQ